MAKQIVAYDGNNPIQAQDCEQDQGLRILAGIIARYHRNQHQGNLSDTAIKAIKTKGDGGGEGDDKKL